MRLVTAFDRGLTTLVGGVFATFGAVELAYLLSHPLGEAALQKAHNTHEPGYEFGLLFLAFGLGFVCFGLSQTNQLRQRTMFGSLCGVLFLLAFLSMLGIVTTAFLGWETDWLILLLGGGLLRQAYHSARNSPEYRYAASYPQKTPPARPSTSATDSIPSNPRRPLRLALLSATVPLAGFFALGIFLGWKIDRWDANQFLPIPDSCLPIILFGAVGLLGAVFVGCETFFRVQTLQQQYPHWSGPRRERLVAPYRDLAVSLGGALQLRHNHLPSLLPHEPERIDYQYRGQPASFEVNSVSNDETAYDETTIRFTLPTAEDLFLQIVPRSEIIRGESSTSDGNESNGTQEFLDHFLLEPSGSDWNPWIESPNFRRSLLQLQKWLVGVLHVSLSKLKIEDATLTIYFRSKCSDFDELSYLHTCATAICDAVVDVQSGLFDQN